MSVLNLGGHIGASVSALVDGQLAPADEERAWTHVLGCAGCRQRVEHEGWLKTSLGSLSDPVRSSVPLGLADLERMQTTLGAWAQVHEIERVSRRRRTAVAVAGASSLGAAVFGLVAFTAPPVSRSEVPSPTTVRFDLLSSVTSAGAGAGAGIGTTVRSRHTAR